MNKVMSIVVKIILGVLACIVVLDKTVTPLVTVMGNSMFPTYRDREMFLSKRVFNHQKLEVGDVVVLKNPSDKGHNILVKRIWYFEFSEGVKTKVAVLGDNEDNSYDSREFGTFPIENIMCVAWKSRPRKVV